MRTLFFNRMQRVLATCLVMLLPVAASLAQGSYRERAREAFQSGDYPKALEYLYQAREQAPGDAGTHFYIGIYSHALKYESRPHPGLGTEWTEREVINSLERALELDPDMGDARYFLGVAHASRAWERLMGGDVEGFRHEFQQGFKKGAFPPWMLEEGRNHLRACPPDAILFISGDLHHNAITWLQVMEGYRNDVSVVKLALLNRPWYLKAYRDGLPGIIRPVPLSWSDSQLGGVQNYPWRPQQINLPIPEFMNQNLDVAVDVDTMAWLIEPDLISPGRRTYLSPMMAAFVDIIEQNAWQRPVFISMGGVTALPVEKYRRQHGPLVQFIPFEGKAHALKLNVEATRDFYFNQDNFWEFSSLREHDFPRVSGVLFNHHMVLLNLCRHYYDQEQWALALEALHRIDVLFPEEIMPIPADFRKFMNELETDIRERMD
jgi:tetratricopeptide (TPR) repeat protein